MAQAQKELHPEGCYQKRTVSQVGGIFDASLLPPKSFVLNEGNVQFKSYGKIEGVPPKMKVHMTIVKKGIAVAPSKVLVDSFGLKDVSYVNDIHNFLASRSYELLKNTECQEVKLQEKYDSPVIEVKLVKGVHYWMSVEEQQNQKQV